MKFISWGLLILGFITIALGTLFSFPLLVWMFKPVFSTTIEGIGISPFLARAIVLLFGAICAYLVMRFVFTLRRRTRLYGLLGIFAVLVAFNLVVYFLEQDKCVRINQFGELERYDGPCLTKEGRAMLGCDTNGELQDRFKGSLTPSGEFREEFLLKHNNLRDIPWFNHDGTPCIFYCIDLDNITSVYVRPGRCRSGEPRKQAGEKVQKLLHEKAMEHMEHEAKVKADEQARVASREVKALADEVRRLKKDLEKTKKARIVVLEKARIVVLDKQYHRDVSSDGRDTLILILRIIEKNGVSVTFNKYTLSLWEWNSGSSSLEDIKKSEPLVLEMKIDDWSIRGKSGMIRKQFSLSHFVEWIDFDKLYWAEIVFYGWDFNGNPQQITAAAIM